MSLSRLFLAIPVLALPGFAATASPLAARGYAVLPEPQRVSLSGPDFRFGPGWGIELNGIAAGDSAVSSLNEGLSSRFHTRLADKAGSSGTVKLVVAPGSVTIGDALDSDKQAIAAQAYQLDLAPKSITIKGNDATGVFYGVQTLVQLAKPKEGALWLPAGQIVDWPDLRMRGIYWDDAHHL